MKEAEIGAEIEDFLEGFNQPIYRGIRVKGFGWQPGRAGRLGVAYRGRFSEVQEIVLAAYAP